MVLMRNGSRLSRELKFSLHISKRQTGKRAAKHLHEMKFGFECLRMNNIVTVQKEKIISTPLHKPCIPCSRHSSMGQAQENNT